MASDWGVILEYPNYAINRDGTIVNLKTNRTISPHRDSYGFDKVTLYNEEGRDTVYVHIMLQTTFGREFILPPTYQAIRVVGTGELFRTVEDCARYYHTAASNIYRVLRGDRKTHHGKSFSVVVMEGEV